MVNATDVPAVAGTECALYRFFDAEGALLYVGITNHLPSRLVDHAASKEWWTLVVSIIVEHFRTRAEAQAGEQAAIDNEGPRFNQVRSVGKTPISSFRIPTDVKLAAVARATSEGRSLTDVLVQNLREYITTGSDRG